MMRSVQLAPQAIARTIDHALLHPTLTDHEVEEGLSLVGRLQVGAACVRPDSVKLASELLEGTGSLVCTVVGFPQGTVTTSTKLHETDQAISQGAREVDVVVNLGKLKSAEFSYVENELRQLCKHCHQRGVLMKIIFETDYLVEGEIATLSQIGREVEADFLKTSTGFGFVRAADGRYSSRGATVEHLRLMRLHGGPEIGLKASGGIRNLTDYLLMVEAGATRIGTSATLSILEQAKRSADLGGSDGLEPGHTEEGGPAY